MSEHETTRRGPFADAIPEDTRKHMRAARDEMCKSWEALLPPDFVKHRRAARREVLLAVRSLVDSALERIEGAEEAA